MDNKFKIFYSNLNKNQKILFFVIIQFLILIILSLLIKIIFTNKPHLEVKDNKLNIPQDVEENLNNTLWHLISKNTKDLNQNIVKDIIIRDDSYSETNKNGVNNANFIIDIDSLKQTYVVSISWSKNKNNINENDLSINCPPQSEMKYPETFCQGMYNNTYSLDLYLPHSVYPDKKETAPNYSIYGNEQTKTISISVSACDPDNFKQQAQEYLNSTPIPLNEYTINYNINSIDIDC